MNIENVNTSQYDIISYVIIITSFVLLIQCDAIWTAVTQRGAARYRIKELLRPCMQL